MSCRVRCAASFRRCASPPERVVARLPEAQIAQSYVVEHAQARRDLRMRGEERERLAHGHLQHVVDTFVLAPHLEHAALVARAAALFAHQLHVGEEAHLDRHRAVALARLAAPARNVERKMPGGQPALFALPAWPQTLRESDRTPSDTSPDSTAASARSAIDPPSRLPQAPRRLRSGRSIRASFRPVRLACERLVEHVVDERRFARAGHAGDRDEQTQRNHQVDALQIVAARAENLQELPLRFPPPLRHRNAQIAAQVAAR